MRKVWIVVANSSEAKIYRAENVNHLVEHKAFKHEEGRLKGSELTSDKPGRMTERGFYGTDTMQEPTPPKVKEAMHFAHEISKFLEQGSVNKDFERLYLIAKPPFLGHLRESLKPNVAKMIELEVHKDLTQVRAEEIRDYLPPVL